MYTVTSPSARRVLMSGFPAILAPFTELVASKDVTKLREHVVAPLLESVGGLMHHQGVAAVPAGGDAPLGPSVSTPEQGSVRASTIA